MNVHLLDVDSSIPNLALMQLSSYHKSIGDTVSIQRAEVPYYPALQKDVEVVLDGYDLVYASAIFKNTYDRIKYKQSLFSNAKVIAGGSGIDYKVNLPLEVMDSELDYSIYPDNDTAYGFISRGCNRHCGFCDVPKKEGRTRQVEFDLNKIIGKFKRVKFMDNNFLQLDNHIDILEWLVEKQIPCQFNQGLDFRLITKENSALVRQLKYIGEYLFAFDDYRYRRKLQNKLKLLDWIPPWKAKFYVYVSPEMELHETVGRIEWLKDRQMLPYVMRDIACWDSKNKDFYTDLAGWGNQPAFLKKMTFSEFCDKRHINKKRAEYSKKLYQVAHDSIPKTEIFDIAAA